MKLLAKRFFWWPGSDLDIERGSIHCVQCRENQPRVAKADINPWQYPHGPCACVHVDYIGPFMGKMSLIIVEA